MNRAPKLNRDAARLIVPRGGPINEALARTTHLGIGAHPDDLEIMTWHGIAHCYANEANWFSGVVVTTGAAGPRRDEETATTDDRALVAQRLAEQTRAAELGDYAALAYLGYESDDIKQPGVASVGEDLDTLLAAMRPDVVYTHSPFDTHASHVAVLAHVVEAVRRLPAPDQPQALYGCEVWGGLDWLPERYKMRFDVSARAALNTELVALHASQVAGGKRYDLATLGRKQAHAT
ncbi:MAG: PIG-L family deacetylase, partial [Myxococcota bacterium]